MKRKIASVVAMSLLGLQALAGVASATHSQGRGHQNVGSGTSECAYGSGLLQVMTDGNVAIGFKTLTIDTVTVVNGIYCDLNADGDGGEGDEFEGAFSTITAMQIVANGDITIGIQHETTFAPVSFSGKALEVDAGGMLVFDGDEAGTGTTRALSVTVSDTALAVNGGTGELVAADMVGFVGNDGPDSFDASKLTAIDVWADGGSGKDSLKGGDGDDVLAGYAYSGTDCTYEASGDTDTVADTVAGGAGDDLLCGDALGLTGDVKRADTILPGDGWDTIVGAAALVSYADATDAVEIDLTDDFDDSVPPVNVASPLVTHDSGAEDTFSGLLADYGKWAGSAKADKFIGSATRNDSFSGLGGADVIVGAGGNDVLSGGDGSDRIRGGGGGDTIWGGAGNDTLSGGAGSDTIRGYSGDDVLYGRGGADSLMGDGGSDEAWGGNGGDLCGAEVTDHCEFAR